MNAYFIINSVYFIFKIKLKIILTKINETI